MLHHPHPLRNTEIKVTDFWNFILLKKDILYQSVIRNHSYCNYQYLGGLLSFHNHRPKGSYSGVGLDTFIQSSTAFLSFKLILKLVGLTSVIVTTSYLTSLGEGQHDLHFLVLVILPYIFNTAGWICLWLWIIVQFVTETDHMLPVFQCHIIYISQSSDF